MFPLIEINARATAHARGLHYGRAAAGRVAHSVATYARMFAGCGVSWRQACERALHYLPVIEALDAALVDELQGIADGSGQLLASVLALNCRTEILPPDFFNDAQADSAAAQAENRASGIEDWSECTAMCVAGSASADGHAWFAQNWDWLGRQRAALVLLKSVDAAGMGFTTLTEAGMLAKIGMNAAGFSLGLNILRSRRDGADPGLPVHVLLRHLLSCHSVAQARERLQALAGLGFGAASNVPCADAHGDIACFEVAPAGWDEVAPTDGVIVHTNHFLCESLAPEQAAMSAALSTASRLATAARHASQPRIGMAELQAFLRDESDGYLSICRAPDPALPPQACVESVAGVIMNVGLRRMWIAPDVPSRVAFEPVAA